ncbi:MAG: peptide chain release factor N(5)-glutamine methyltransferase [Corynebacterium casei]|uniref:peptide chain release factor N(5)-glutamine methyltransferase n=1 Tax=Corynebacterium casei TaxID=160386 RepID=UPI00265452F5|nr:peptide chain release factor N(5)-glutamine methyltransferase [Corynebacterium casei]
MSHKATFDEALRIAAGRLRAVGVDSAEWDARMLLAHVLNVGHMDIPSTQEATHAEQFYALIDRRAQREPLQHIIGTAPFGPLDLEVGPGVFIPRPETETLADWAVNYLNQHFPRAKFAGAGESLAPAVVDLCTGSGALAAYIAHYRPDVQVFAVELSDASLPFTQRNLAGTSVQIIQSDVTSVELLNKLEAVVGRVDLVVTNPPYVPEDPNLAPEVYHDPHDAVFSGVEGMDTINAMLPNVLKLLARGGAVGIEHDDSTSELVQRAANQAGLVNVSPLKDLGGTARFVLAKAPS